MTDKIETPATPVEANAADITVAAPPQANVVYNASPAAEMVEEPENFIDPDHEARINFMEEIFAIDCALKETGLSLAGIIKEASRLFHGVTI